MYIYGAEINGGFDRTSLDRFDGSTGYYLYYARGSVSGITNEEGQVYQSYRYSVTGEITFGAPQYENEYTYNGESYNPNIQSQYLRARYYCVVTAVFLTEDSCLGSLTEPLTLNRYNYCVSSYLNYTDPSGNSTENDVDRILREYPILSNQKSEQAIAVESFVNGVLGSAAKVIIDKPTAAYMPGMAMEELYGGQYRFNERAYNNYVNLTETLIEALSKDATNKTAYYAGRCTGDVVITAVGGVEFVYGLITTISGGSGSAAALATGIGIAAEPVTIAVTAEGVVTVVDGVNTIHYGITAFKKDADKGKEAKEADSKAAESGRYSKTYYEGTTKVGGQINDISRIVYQRNDIDWNRIDPATGLTNKQLAQAGSAPYANDGTKIELHHLLQQEPGPMVEIPASLHDKYYKTLHGLVGDGESFRNNPDLEKQYNNFRAKYWRWRAKNL